MSGAIPDDVTAGETPPEDITPGHLLGGRVRHDQFRHGHRTGLEPVLLAATIPARAGDHVVEGGSGSGAALLCLAARVPGLSGIGIERDPRLAALARANLCANGIDALAITAQDIAGFRADTRFDHAFANPPWHAPDGTRSPDAVREAARRTTPDLLAVWAERLADGLRPRGTLTFVLPAAAVPACIAAMTRSGCGSLAILPLWPRARVAAKLVLVRSIRDGRGACRILPGLVLHDESGGFTPEADAILRDGAGLEMV